MAAPERLNVLLSRARNGLVLIGNPQTFVKGRQNRKTWEQLFQLLRDQGSIYDGLPVKCERHPERTATLRESRHFEAECPDGGCKEAWCV